VTCIAVCDGVTVQEKTKLHAAMRKPDFPWHEADLGRILDLPDLSDAEVAQILQAMTMPGLTHPLNIYLLCTNGLAPLMNVTAATYHFEAVRAAKIACVKLTYKRENVKNFADAGVEKAKRIRYISEAMPTRLLGQEIAPAPKHDVSEEDEFLALLAAATSGDSDEVSLLGADLTAKAHWGAVGRAAKAAYQATVAAAAAAAAALKKAVEAALQWGYTAVEWASKAVCKTLTAWGSYFPAAAVNPTTSAPWRDTDHLGVGMFMAFVAYNDEAGIKSRIDAQTVGIVKTGGFSYLPGSFYSGPTGLQRFMATGTVNGEKTLVLAFRGSSEGSDWAHNFQFIQAAWNYGTQTGTVHTGFKGQFDDKLSDWAALVKATIAAGNKKVIVAGHSLGGALSNLAAMYVAEAGFGHSSIDVITFGAPSAGNAGWQAHLAAKVANRAHVVNDADPVPCTGSLTGQPENSVLAQFDHLAADGAAPSWYSPIRKHSCAYAVGTAAIPLPTCFTKDGGFNGMDHMGDAYCADIAGLLPGYQNNVHEADICGRS